MTPSYGDAVSLDTNVLVTKLPITDSTRLEILPDPVEGTPNSQVEVAYWLRFGGAAANDQNIPAAAVNAALTGTSVATLF